jgi:hypothetical protein
MMSLIGTAQTMLVVAVGSKAEKANAKKNVASEGRQSVRRSASRRRAGRFCDHKIDRSAERSAIYAPHAIPEAENGQNRRAGRDAKCARALGFDELHCPRQQMAFFIGPGEVSILSLLKVRTQLYAELTMLGTARHAYASAQAKTRRSTVSAFVSKQRPWLTMMRSGRHESIFSTAALVFLFCKRSGNRIPKNSWPAG